MQSTPVTPEAEEEMQEKDDIAQDRHRFLPPGVGACLLSKVIIAADDLRDTKAC
jgi:hypothetical protein